MARIRRERRAGANSKSYSEIINPFIFISNKRRVLSSEGFSALEKKRHHMSSEGCAAHPVRQNICCRLKWLFGALFFKFEHAGSECGSPLQTIMAVWHALNFEKSVPNGHYYLHRASTPDQITQQNSLQRAGWPYRE